MTRNFFMIRVLGRPAIRVISWQCRSLAGWHHDSVPLAVSDLRLQVHKSIHISSSLPTLSAEYEGPARSEGDHESLARGRAAAAAAAARAALGGRRTSDSARESESRAAGVTVIGRKTVARENHAVDRRGHRTSGMKRLLSLSRGCWCIYRRSAFLCIQKVAEDEMSVAWPGPGPAPGRAGAGELGQGDRDGAHLEGCAI